MSPVRRSRFALHVTVLTACALLAPQAVVAQSLEPPTPVPAPHDDPFGIEEPEPPAPGAAALPDDKLDIEGMRRFVRELPAEETPPGPMGTVFSAAPAPELQRFKNTFDDGKRPWCLTAFQGAGILALIAMPLATLLDKKDHGCKW